MSEKQKFDITVSSSAKMIQALCMALKIEPSVAGVIRAMGNDPEAVQHAINLLQDHVPQFVGMLLEMGAREKRIEEKLDLLLAERISQEIADVVIDKGSATILAIPQKVSP